MEVSTRGQKPKQLRINSTGEQVWERRRSYSFSIIKPSVLLDFFFFLQLRVIIFIKNLKVFKTGMLKTQLTRLPSTGCQLQAVPRKSTTQGFHGLCHRILIKPMEKGSLSSVWTQVCLAGTRFCTFPQVRSLWKISATPKSDAYPDHVSKPSHDFSSEPGKTSHRMQN